MFYCDVVIWFFVYSLIGWSYETLFCSIQAGGYVSRGFFFGPYLPIYGFGAIFIILLLHKQMKKFNLFLFSMAVTTILEYLTSWVLEVFFQKRWWDYTDYFLDINGRVCLIGSIAFGLFGVCLVNYIHPALKKQTNRIPMSARFGIAIAIFALLSSDSIISILNYIEDLTTSHI